MPVYLIRGREVSIRSEIRRRLSIVFAISAKENGAVGAALSPNWKSAASWLLRLSGVGVLGHGGNPKRTDYHSGR